VYFQRLLDFPLVNGDCGRDELGGIGNRSCGYGHGIVGWNYGRGLVVGWNITGDGVWAKRATLSGRDAGKSHAGVFWAVANDCRDPRSHAGSQRSGGRKFVAERNHNRGSLVLGIAAGGQCDDHDHGNRGLGTQQEDRFAKGHWIV
jgi:hypothetical protein